MRNEGLSLGAEAARQLARLDFVKIKQGLTDREFSIIEQKFQIEFADDHRSFLAAGLPVWAYGYDDDPNKATIFGWPDWRNGDPDLLRGQINLPIEYLLQEITDGYWHHTWGDRPQNIEESLFVAKKHLAEVPRTIPIYARRYLISGQGSFGNPVLSILGTDVVCYGKNILDYIDREFINNNEDNSEGLSTDIPFWKDFL